MKRLVIKVYGRVQGVFFRHTARMHAEKLGITGFVRNEADDSVAIVAEGEKEAMNKFLEWCRRGPPLAKIEKFDAEWQEATEEFKKFTIQ